MLLIPFCADYMSCQLNKLNFEHTLPETVSFQTDKSASANALNFSSDQKESLRNSILLVEGNAKWW
jgi:hypothetical protein